MTTRPDLTIATRSCLLKAARERLAQLHQDYEAVMRRPDMHVQRDILFSEIACITSGIAWLWLQPAIDDGG